VTEIQRAYGYLRIRPETDDNFLVVVEERTRDCADALGLLIVSTHYEEGPGIAPSRLIRKLIREDIHHVVVPSLMQITEHPYLQLLVSESITEDADALLHEASEVHGWADVR
jgi:hypothetical protein